MASRRLLLFTDVNSTSDRNFNFDGNITLDCIANCIGVCIYSVCFPDPPLSPASLPNDNNSSDVNTPINFHRRDRLTPTLVITAVSAVAGSFAFLLILYAYLRFRRRARRHHRPPGSEAAAGSVNGNDDEIGGDPPSGGEIEHHIWHIRTQGLDDITVASITSWVYKSSDGLIDGRDCSVCLGEFRDGELVRLLPKCSHAFHLPCIDRWLRSHVNCPLCRAPIVSPPTAVVPAPSPTSLATVFISEPAELVSGAPAPLENAQIEALPWESGREDIEIGLVTHPSEGSSSRPSISEILTNSSEEEDTLQPIRRSVSMDTFSLDVLLRGERPEEEGMASANREKRRGFLKGRWTREQPTKMERSLSSQSARWFFPRYGRPQNSVLPL